MKCVLMLNFTAGASKLCPGTIRYLVIQELDSKEVFKHGHQSCSSFV